MGGQPVPTNNLIRRQLWEADRESHRLYRGSVGDQKYPRSPEGKS
jgi:hypothetical protein